MLGERSFSTWKRIFDKGYFSFKTDGNETLLSSGVIEQLIMEPPGGDTVGAVSVICDFTRGGDIILRLFLNKL